jgi:GTPase SAR1 family protein
MFSILFIKPLLPTGLKTSIRLSSVKFCEQLQKDIGRAYHQIEYIEGNLFRQAMLIMVCSYLEEAMDLIGEAVISEYPAKISKKTKENWFEKRKKFFEEAGVSFKEIKDQCERINDLLVVRNCIVHSGGRIDKYRYPAQVEEAVERLKERDKDRNVNLVEITVDKFLYLGDDLVVTAIISSKEIISQCSKTTSGKE